MWQTHGEPTRGEQIELGDVTQALEHLGGGGGGGDKGLWPLEIVFLPCPVPSLSHFLLCMPQTPARLRSLLASPLPPDSL